MDIPLPEFNLNVGSGLHGEQTAKMMIGIEKICVAENPDLVLIYGDTNSSLAGALVAAKLNIPLAHVEAGLRSKNLKMPEELNRIVSDRISNFLFAPTTFAKKNLLSEGIAPEKVHVVGDVMLDASKFYQKLSESKSNILDTLRLKGEIFILVTVHRAENTDELERLSNIARSLIELLSLVRIIFLVHPRTRKNLVSAGLLDELSKSVQCIEPVGYLDMIALEKNAKLIVTDSGGIQKEAFFYQVPCVTFRDETEWLELVESGWNDIFSPRSVDVSERLKNKWSKGLNLSEKSENMYGDGDAGKKILKILSNKM